MEYTNNYQLPTWAESDRVLMDDFNDMTEKLETALTGHGEALAGKGNCQIYTASYVGTNQYGSAHPNTLTFPQKPMIVAVSGHPGDQLFIAFQGVEQALVYVQNFFVMEFTWSGKSVSWYQQESAFKQLNQSGRTYYVTALLAAGE